MLPGSEGGRHRNNLFPWELVRSTPCEAEALGSDLDHTGLHGCTGSSLEMEAGLFPHPRCQSPGELAEDGERREKTDFPLPPRSRVPCRSCFGTYRQPGLVGAGCTDFLPPLRNRELLCLRPRSRGCGSLRWHGRRTACSLPRHGRGQPQTIGVTVPGTPARVRAKDSHRPRDEFIRRVPALQGNALSGLVPCWEIFAETQN